MVRETRYLLVRNIPEKSTEESINHYFQRYGKIQSVKIQPPAKDSETTITATVAFMDIRSASKAHNSKNTIDSNVLRTEYWDALSSTVRTQGDSARSSSSIPGASGTYGSGAPASTVSRSAGSNGSSGAHGSWTTGIPKHLLVLKKSRWRLLELCTFLFSYCAYCGKYSCEFQHCLLKLYMGFMFCVCTLDYSISFVIALPITALLDYFTPVASTSETPSFTLDYFWITFSHGVISSSAVAFCSLQSTPLSHLLTELRLHNGVEAASSDFMMGVHSYHWILE